MSDNVNSPMHYQGSGGIECIAATRKKARHELACRI